MGIRKQGAVARPLRILFEMGTVGELTDGQLLERFATARGAGAELAFEVLVERHGGMVLRVCRSVLGDSGEAEDAFQATFLVLVRRARGLWVRESLGPWLHQVAYRTARCALRSAGRRRRLEEGWAGREVARGHRIDTETRQLLHEEIERLPERFRAPVVLCDLEGQSHEQAARQLGWPVGTVKSRQARGRARLRDQLVRRGLHQERGVVGVMLGIGGRDLLVSPALLHGTVEAALRLGIVRGVAGGAAVSLMQGVLRTMWIWQWVKVGSVVVTSSAGILGAGFLLQTGTAGAFARARDNAAQGGELLEQEVKREPLMANVAERGNLESSSNSDAYCAVEGQTTITKMLPEGSRVKKGDVVCELDSVFLKDQLINQRITTKSAEALFLNAKLAREVAEIAVNEYEQGILKSDQATLRNSAEAAHKAVERAESRLQRIKRAQEQIATAPIAKADKRPADVVAELDLIDRLEASQQLIEEGKAALELAKSKQEQLEKYTSVKMIKELRIELDEKRSKELAREATWDLEKSKEAKLERQISACVIRSPGTGVVIYANTPDRNQRGDFRQVEEGVTVRERQKLFSVPDTSKPMLVNVKISESQIANVANRMKAKVRVDSFANLVLTGRVVEVAPLPDAVNIFEPKVKVYTTKVRIDDGPKGLRPGMSASVEILIDSQDDVVSVPVEAVVHYEDKDHVAVKVKGGIEWRDVKLGGANEKRVEVKEGIKDGERVVLNPLSLMSEEEKTRKLGGGATGRPSGEGAKKP